MAEEFSEVEEVEQLEDDDSLFGESREVRGLAEELPPGDSAEDDEFLDPNAARFDEWDPIAKEGPPLPGEDHEIRPFDWMRKWGFHHSSTEGRFIEKNVPLAHNSWLNRPYHLDWFAGPLLADSVVSDSITQSNDILVGLRLGWDFDYYWGIEWRFGWAAPDIFIDESSHPLEGDFFISDIDFVYYPWGDTKVRPYFLAGLGVTQIDSLRDTTSPFEATLLTMPLGVGVQFTQTPWLAWRLEIADNLAFGSDGVDTMNNFAFTGGMEIRLGAKPNSYWPWRSSRTIW